MGWALAMSLAKLEKGSDAMRRAERMQALLKPTQRRGKRKELELIAGGRAATTLVQGFAAQAQPGAG